MLGKIFGLAVIREFANAARQAKASPDPEVRLEAATLALSLANELPGWPFKEPSRRRGLGELYYIRGASLAETTERLTHGKVEEILNSFGKALQYLSKEDVPLWGYLQRDRATALLRRGRGKGIREDIQEAIEACNEALAVFRVEEYPAKHGVVKFLRAQAQVQASQIRGQLRTDLEGAINDYRSAIEVLDPDQDLLAWVDAKIGLAETLGRRPGYRLTQNIEVGITAAREALERLEPIKHRLDWAHAQVTLGNLLADRSEGDPTSNLEESIRHLEMALSVLDPVGDVELKIIVLDHLASSFLDRRAGSPTDNVERALSLLEEAISLVHSADDQSFAGKLYMSLGNALKARRRGAPAENFDRCLKAFRKAGDLVRRDKEPYFWAAIEENLGQAYLESGSGTPGTIREAISAFHRALEIVGPLEEPRTWARIQASLGNAYSRLPDKLPTPEEYAAQLDKAVAAYDAALTRATRETDPWKWAGLHKNRALAFETLRLIAVQVEAEEFVESLDEEAKLSLEKSLEIFTRERSPRGHVTASLMLGMTHLRAERWESAESCFHSALEASEYLVGGAETHRGEAEEVLRSLGQLGVNTPAPALIRGDATRALALWEFSRARLLAKALHLDSISISDSDRLRLRAAEEEEDVIEESLESADAASGRWDLLERLSEVRRRKKEIVDPFRKTRILDDRSIRELLRTCIRGGRVLIAPILTEVGSWILLGREEAGETKLEILRLEPTKPENRLEQILRDWLSSTAWDAREEMLRSLGTRLWDLFGARLAERLSEARVPDGVELVFLPQGGLGLLPLGITESPEGTGSYLERYKVSYAPSLTALAHAMRRAGSIESAELRSAAVIEADPVGNLWAYCQEASLVRSWFAESNPSAADILNEQQAVQLLEDKHLWHFSTHGSFDQEVPTRSGLTLVSSERLTLEALLGSRGLGTPRLAVLAACSSGIHDFRRVPLEFMGLPTGFLQAGAAGVIASLWNVGDVATMLLMGKFYDVFLGEGLKPSHALREAQNWLRRATGDNIRAQIARWHHEGRFDQSHFEELANSFATAGATQPIFPDPTFWSAFVHIGA